MGSRGQITAVNQAWPFGKGMMAGMIRSHGWHLSPLGPSTTWPQALKTAVEIMLASPQPAMVCWGRSLITLYNDAFIAQIGPRHPAVFGRPLAEIRADQWDDLKTVVEAVLDGEPQHITETVITSSEPGRWFSYTWTPLREPGGAVAGLYCVASETTLQLGDGTLRTVVENARDAVSMLDLATRTYVFMNAAHTRLTGYTLDELRGLTTRDVAERMHPDDIARIGGPEKWNQHIDSGTPVQYRWMVKSGEYRWFSNTRNLVRDDSGKPIAVVIVSRDITEEKQIEEALHASETRLKLALDTAGMGNWEWDVASDRAVWNTKLFELLGLDPVPDPNPALFFTALHPDDREPVSRSLEAILKGGSDWRADYRVIWPDGSQHWVVGVGHLFRNPDGSPKTMVGVNFDFTERQRALDVIEAGRATLEAALNAMTDAVFIADTEGHILKMNKAFAAFHRFNGTEECASEFARFAELFENYDSEGRLVPFSDWVTMRALKGETVTAAEYTIKRKDTGESWIGALSSSPIRNAEGAITGVVCTARDVTAEKKAENALRLSEAHYRLLHETMRDGFAQVSIDGQFLDCNSAYCELLGYSKEELLSLNYLELTPERWRKAEDEIISRDIIGRGYSDVYEKEYRRKDGIIIPVELRAVLVRDEKGNPASMWGIVRDISERRAQEVRHNALKEQLIHVGRVQELTQVSAGIAHELNQPLAAMNNYAATARRMIARNDIDAASSVIAKAGQQAARAGDIIRRMRDFVEKRNTNKKCDDINAMVKEAAELGLIGAKADGIEVRFDLAPGPLPVTADRVQIEQVLVNLLHNAMDAMIDTQDRILTLTTAVCGPMIETKISDTGHGIAPDVLARLFEPFTTTKPGGMGIGLAISKSIIDAHGGEIFAAANPCGGTTFTLRLPVALNAN